jgi:hypothetical protein
MKILRFLMVIMIVFSLSSCSDHDKEDDEEVYAGWQDPKIVGKDAAAKTNTKVWYNRKATFTAYGVRNGGRQAWRIPAKGTYFGRKIKVVFANGHTVMVNNTSKNYREGDGFVFKPGIGPNGEGEHNTGTAHGGVYLHAPYGNNSRQVTFYFYK